MIMKIKERMQSDKAAAGTVETIIIIALAVFAALALFTFVLTPTQESADDLGTTISEGVGSILQSDGDASKINFGGAGGGGGGN